jgi:hypothetical protein
LRGQHGLALGLGLAGNFSQTAGLSLTRGFSFFRGFAGGDLRLFLADALGLFLYPAALGGCSLFRAQPGFFASLGARC